MYDKHTTDSVINYNRIASHYDESFDGRFTKDLKNKIVDSIVLTNKSRVLDVACGNGTLLNMLNNKREIDGYGIDISDKMVQEAQRLYPMFQFSISNSNALKFNDSFFDCITVCAAFHHFSDPKGFLKEAKRVLKRNGLLFIMEPYFNPFLRVLFNLLIPFMKMGDVKVYKKDEIEKMLHKSGYSDITYSRQTNHGCLFIGKST